MNGRGSDTASVSLLAAIRSEEYAANADGIPDGKVLQRGKTEPGTTFVYNNWGFNVAGTVFEMKVGKSIYDVFAMDVAEPLQLQDWNRYGQRISVFPALDMVVAHKSARNAKHPTKGSDYSELVKTIIRAKVSNRNQTNGRM